MSALLQVLARARRAAGLPLRELERRTGAPSSRLSVLLREEGAPDARLSTVEALADALDHEVMVVPKHLAPFVREILATGGDLREVRQAPSALERSLGDLPAEVASGLRGWGEAANETRSQAEAAAGALAHGGKPRAR